MARKDQPYYPLYVKDLLTDDRLAQCSPSSVGVYLYVLCHLHKSETYGMILLKQNYKSCSNKIAGFATQFAKLLPYDIAEISAGLQELIFEEIFTFEDDFIVYKYMIKRRELSEKRAGSGSEGGKKTAEKFAKANGKPNTKANRAANAGIGIVINTDNEIIEKGVQGEKTKLENTFNKFLQFRKEIKKPVTQSGIEPLKKKIWKLAGQDEKTAIEIMETSMANGWQGVFEIKRQKSNKPLSTFGVVKSMMNDLNQQRNEPGNF